MAIQLTYIGSGTITTDGTDFDFGNFDVGAGTCRVVVGLTTIIGASTTTVGISIGGNVPLFHAAFASGGEIIAAVASLIVPGGGAVNVSALLDGTQANASCHVWRLDDADLAFDAGGSATTSTSAVATLDIPAGGAAVFAVSRNSTSSIAWSSATERFDALIESTNRHAAADKTSSSFLDEHAETASWSFFNQRRGLILAVSFSPVPSPSTWHLPLSEPQRFKLSVPTYQQQSFINEAFFAPAIDLAVTQFTPGWFRPLSEPLSLSTPRRLPTEIQLAYIDTLRAIIRRRISLGASHQGTVYLHGRHRPDQEIAVEVKS